ncbi:hypothetical protein DNHGIG_37830 [Collibacillus ludicampi]|uniref:Uncharacterized protein n=1 Tax=Collibacillus ludicampi TaxID=2771369 RepID=A0AAV4LLJ7_9BACL|nr:hypothetical protein [Collibacillus ludicampi]GIM48234.1 hypothetical protein DNHGIG_37830 [Collibacillus ludicampi]
MLQHVSRSLRYSLEGFLKRTFYVYNEPMTEEDIVQIVKEHWLAMDEKNRDTIEVRVHMALSTESGVFERKGNRYVMREHVPDDLHDLAYKFLAEKMYPQKHGELLRHIQQVTKRSRGELMSRVDFERDWRFARLTSGEWTLTEWSIINDEVVDLMTTLNVRNANRQELLELVAVDSKGETIVFFPELDPRFQVGSDGQIELLAFQDPPSNEAKASDKRDKESHFMLNNEETEEKYMTAKKDLIASILMELEAYLNRLEERDQQIPQEVMAYFHNDDLKGIERLMQERKRNAEFSTDLQELLKKWNVKAEEMVHV